MSYGELHLQIPRLAVVTLNTLGILNVMFTCSSSFWNAFSHDGRDRWNARASCRLDKPALSMNASSYLDSPCNGI